jgi:glycosyltransferase involved in cell wall biosynthesis
VSGRRILLLSDLFAPVIGGTEGHVGALARALADRGHTVSVATAQVPGTPPFEVADGVRVHRMRGLAQRAGAHESAGRPFHPPFPDPLVTRALWRVVEKERPDVVHAHSPIVHSFVPLKRRSRARLVLTLHDYAAICAVRVLMREGSPCSGPGLVKCNACARKAYGTARGVVLATGLRAARPALRAVDAVIAVSGAVARACAPLGRTIEVVPNFLRAGAVASGVRAVRPGWLPGGPYILYVGELGANKGVDVLLRAHAQLTAPPPLVLVGSPSPSIPRISAPGVIVHHDAPHDVVMRAWLDATVGAVPSVWGEPCPTTALEAAASGTPLVASRIGGLPDLVDDGATGLLVTPGDEGALAGALRRLLADDPLRRAMSAAAKQRAGSFEVGAVVSRLEEIYGERTGQVRSPMLVQGAVAR